MDTISISKPEVPTYLRCGEFYRSLSNDEDHEQISVPSSTLKADTTVTNNEDLHHLLTSLRFWGVSSIQQEVVKYCLLELESPCDVILQEFAQDFPFAAALISVLPANPDEKVLVAVNADIPEIVRNLPENLTVNFDCCSSAARAGNLEILQCLHERGGVLNSSVLHAALEGGDKSLACVQYLRAQGVEWLSNALTTALKAGSKECFHYALQDGCAWAEGVAALCEDQYVEALKYAIQRGCPVNKYLAVVAAGNGAIKCLQVLHEVNCPWGTGACSQAAMNGHIDCLQYLHENGCPWGEGTVYWAANDNHIECVQYALQQGCPIHSYGSFTAAHKGFLSILQSLHEAGAPWDTNTCTEAARNGHLNCLQYAHEHGCPWDDIIFRSALESGQLECLKYLLENGCPIDMKECQALIAQGVCSQVAVKMVRSFHPDLL